MRRKGCPEMQQEIRIPSALKGGQKQETRAEAVPVKRRLTVKTTDIGGKGAGKAAKMSPTLSGPCKVIKRVKDAKGYILDKKKIYVCSTSERSHGPFYLKALELLAKEIDEGWFLQLRWPVGGLPSCCRQTKCRWTPAVRHGRNFGDHLQRSHKLWSQKDARTLAGKSDPSMDSQCPVKAHPAVH